VRLTSFLVVLLSALLLFGCSSSKPFDSERWKSANLRTRDRVEMMDSLLVKHPLKGLPREEVVDLLGKPTPTDKWKEWDMIYVLGPTDPMPIDHEWLVIKLDNRGRVLSFKMTED
jgi:outer membrane protein assembly factor BamE (lipoprotein component of BamABCDE complex)